jgi:hypothetical protein
LPADHVIVTATLISVSPEAQQAAVRLEFDWADQSTASSRTLFDGDGRLQQPLHVVTQGPIADTHATPITTTYEFPKGEQMSPIDVTFNVVGDVVHYPFDHYTSDFTVAVTRGDPTLEAAPVPSFVQIGSYIGGWQVAVRRTSNGLNSIHDFAINITRASSAKTYTIFIMVLMWALALAGVAMTLMLILLHRPIDSGPLTYLAALLFAFPLIRDTLPGEPGLGTLIDYVSYFWAEAIVAIALLALLITWLIREDRAHRAAQ